MGPTIAAVRGGRFCDVGLRRDDDAVVMMEQVEKSPAAEYEAGRDARRVDSWRAIRRPAVAAFLAQALTIGAPFAVVGTVRLISGGETRPPVVLVQSLAWAVYVLPCVGFVASVIAAGIAGVQTLRGWAVLRRRQVAFGLAGWALVSAEATGILLTALL